MATQAQLAAVQQLYIGYLGRAADQAGQEFWANAIANGTSTIESVALGFTLSQEYQSIYGGLENAALVAKVYENLLDRAPDAEGQAFWVKALEDGIVTADTLVATMLGNLGTQDQQIVNNKVYVANTYTNKAGADYNVKAGTEVVTAPEGKTFDASVVTEKLADIANGNLPGEVPGLHLIAAVDKAVAAKTAYADEVGYNSGDAITKLNTAKTAADTAGSVEQNKLNVQQDQLDLKNAADALIDLGNTDAEKAAIRKEIAAYDAAVVAAKAAEKAFDDNKVAYAQVKGGFDALPVDQKGTYGNADAAVTAINGAATAAERAKEIEKVLKLEFGAEIVKQANLAQAQKEAADAKTAAESDLTTRDATKGAAYATAKTDLATAETKLADAEKAAADLVKAQAVVDQFNALDKAIVDANQAINDFEAANDVDLQILTGLLVATAKENVKDVFYFSPEKIANAESYKTINNFGNGDAIVLGANYSQGADVAKGDNNKLEFFLVQTDKGLQVVVESAAYGSQGVDVVSVGGVNYSVTTGDTAFTIDLVGVKADQVTFDNGVLSFV